jgi:hypothetical protein
LRGLPVAGAARCRRCRACIGCRPRGDSSSSGKDYGHERAEDETTDMGEERNTTAAVRVRADQREVSRVQLHHKPEAEERPCRSSERDHAYEPEDPRPWKSRPARKPYRATSSAITHASRQPTSHSHRPTALSPPSGPARVCAGTGPIRTADSALGFPGERRVCGGCQPLVVTRTGD